MTSIFAGPLTGSPCTTDEQTTKTVTFMIALASVVLILGVTAWIVKKQVQQKRIANAIAYAILGLFLAAVAFFGIGLFLTPWCS